MGGLCISSDDMFPYEKESLCASTSFAATQLQANVLPELCACACACFGCGSMRATPGLILCCGSGFQALVLTALLVALGVSVGLPLGALPGMLLPLAFATTLTSFIFSLLLYAKALVAPASALAPGGNSGEKGPSEVGVR